MSQHFTVNFDTILNTPGVPLSYEFWQQVVARVRKMKRPLTTVSAGEALFQIRKEMHARLDDLEKQRLDAVRVFNDCRAVERDMAVLMQIQPATIRKKKRSRSK